MEGSRVGLLVTRVFQLIFGAIVLGVAAQLAVDFNDIRSACDEANHYQKNACDKSTLNSLLKSPQPSVEYAAFTGAWGILAALVTLVAVWVESIPSVVSLGFDVLASIFYLAGGINSAVQRSDDLIFDDDITTSDFRTRWNTTTAFMFLGFIASIAGLVLVFLSRRSSGGPRHSAV